MQNIQATFSGFSVDDIDNAKQFYGTVLGLTLKEEVGGTSIQLPHGAQAWMYLKPNHQPATYTMLNFVVPDIDAAHKELTDKGVQFEHYPGLPQDENGIMRGKEHDMGPNIAWFTDPAGNILSIIET